MNLDKDDLKAIGGLMDEKLLEFHEKVTAPMIETKLLEFHEKVLAPVLDDILDSQKNMEQKIDSLESRTENLENNSFRIERKLDNVTDMLAVRVTDHEKRIVKMERAII